MTGIEPPSNAEFCVRSQGAPGTAAGEAPEFAGGKRGL